MLQVGGIHSRSWFDAKQRIRVEVEPIVDERNEMYRIHRPRIRAEQSLWGSLDRGGPFVILAQIYGYLPATIGAVRSRLQSEEEIILLHYIGMH